MRLFNIKELLEATVLWGKEYLNNDVDYAFGCDLLSDVLAFTPSKTLLLTGLTNRQVINTAEMIEAVAVVFVRGKKPDHEVIEIAKQKKIPLLATDYMLYDSCGILYSNGLKGCGKLK